MARSTSHHSTVYGTEEDLSHLTAQAHGLYLRLRDRLVVDEDYYPVVKQAYDRYRRRVAHLHPADVD